MPAHSIIVLTSALTPVLAPALLGLTASIAGAGAPAFQPLGDLPGGEEFSQGSAVSDNGQFVGGISIDGANLIQPVIWNGLAPTILMAPPGFDGAYLNDISGDGSSAVALGPRFPDGFFGIHWDAKGNTHVVNTTMPGNISALVCIDYDGDIAGGATEQSFFGSGDALIYNTATGEQNIGDLAGGVGDASLIGVTNDGSTFVGYGSDDDGRKPIRWDATNGFQMLPTVIGGNGLGQALNIGVDGGTIVGSLLVSGVESPAYWDAPGDPHLIAIAEGFAVGHANATSADGSIIVGIWRENEFSDEFGSRAFIWDATNGVRSLRDFAVHELGLDLTGWTLNIATDITPDGSVIVGTAVNPGGALEAFRLVVGSGNGCPADLADGKGQSPDGVVNLFDLLALLANWGTDNAGADIAEPNDVVNLFDLLSLLAAWGGCP